MTKDEALDLALEVLEQLQGGCTDHDDGTVEAITVWCPEVIDAIKQARALDKKAENARELGLDYEPADGTQVSKVWWDGEKLMAKPIPLEDFYQPAPVQSLPFGVGGGLVAIKTLLSRDPCVHANTAIEMIDAILKEHPAAQPAPVQEPLGYLEIDDIESQREYPHNCRNVNLWHEGGEGMAAIYTTPPAAQAAPVQEPKYWNVIDPAGSIVASETDAIRGWARIAGSYKPTVEGLLGFHDQGWRVLPKVPPPAAQRQWVGLTDECVKEIREQCDSIVTLHAIKAIEAKLKEMNT